MIGQLFESPLSDGATFSRSAHDAGGDQEHKFGLRVLFDVSPKERSEQGEITEYGYLLTILILTLADEASNCNGQIVGCDDGALNSSRVDGVHIESLHIAVSPGDGNGCRAGGD